jgi:hypothetical protein
LIVEFADFRVDGDYFAIPDNLNRHGLTMPTISPTMLKSGPPELPGLMDASV